MGGKNKNSNEQMRTNQKRTHTVGIGDSLHSLGITNEKKLTEERKVFLFLK